MTCCNIAQHPSLCAAKVPTVAVMDSGYRPSSSKIPFISPEDPLPNPPQSEGRWALPFVSKDGLWQCYLRKPLTKAEELAGLLYVVYAKDRDELEKLQAHEDEKAARFAMHVEAWKHTNTL
jgi:hypothetical protein